jgi:hypothetical protein
MRRLTLSVSLLLVPLVCCIYTIQSSFSGQYMLTGTLQTGSGNSFTLSSHELLLYKIASNTLVTWNFQASDTICDTIVVCTISTDVCDNVLNYGDSFQQSDCIDSASELSSCWHYFNITKEKFSSGGCTLVIDYDSTGSSTTIIYDLSVETESGFVSPFTLSCAYYSLVPGSSSSSVSIVWIVIYTLVALFGAVILLSLLIWSKRCLVPTARAVVLADSQTTTPQVVAAVVSTGENAAGTLCLRSPVHT